jgi:predicted membrane protein
MDTNTQSTPSKILVGALLIIIGGLFLLRSFQILPFEITHVIFSWRFGLLIIGIVILLNSNNKILGIILTTIGGLLLFPRIFPEIDIDVKLILGIVIIALGVYVIFRSSGGKFQPKLGGSSDQINKDYLDDVAVFGGGTKVLTSNSFKGGNITAIFGGSEIDLTACKLAEGNNVLNITAIFGGSTIIVPRDWNVLLNVTPLFGGFSNKIRREPNLVVDQSRTLVIKGVAMFGGGEIKSYY